MSIIFFLNIDVFADSPSFIRQEVSDSINDWNLWMDPSNYVYSNQNYPVYLDIAKNIAQCHQDNLFFSPDIESVSYQSDGKILNATIWLTDNFKEPIPNSFNPYNDEELLLTVYNNQTLNEYDENIVLNMLLVSEQISASDILSNYTLAGNTAHGIFLNYNDDNNNDLKKFQIWTEFNKTIYEISYTTLSYEFESDYDKFLKKILDSLYIGKKENIKNNYKDSHLEIYENSELRISYPNNWHILETNSSNEMQIMFKPSLNNESINPSWQSIDFAMSIDVKSVHDKGVDYRLTISKTPYYLWTEDWIMQFKETSAENKVKLLKEEKIKNLYNKNFSYYIPISLDLSKINFPIQYNVVVSMTNKIVLNGKICSLVDNTNWIMIPPPIYELSANPNSINLRPGESEDILLTINGTNNNIDSKVSLSIENEFENISIIFSPQYNISIPKTSIGTSTMSISLDDAIPKKLLRNSYTIPILANVSFPTTITNNRGSEFLNSQSEYIIERLDYTMTILEKIPLELKIKSFIEEWLNPISGTMISIITIIGGILGWKIGKKARKGD
jgi:hypothetical protein